MRTRTACRQKTKNNTNKKSRFCLDIIGKCGYNYNDILLSERKYPELG